MKAAEYLRERGWTVRDVDCDDGTAGMWTTFAHPGECYSEEQAVGVQRALDAADERAAWVAFTAGALAYPGGSGVDLTARAADEALAEYRARFAVEVES